jgi:hypothetical protein
MKKAACASHAAPQWKNAIKIPPRKKKRITKPSTDLTRAVAITAENVASIAAATVTVALVPVETGVDAAVDVEISVAAGVAGAIAVRVNIAVEVSTGAAASIARSVAESSGPRSHVSRGLWIDRGETNCS